MQGIEWRYKKITSNNIEVWFAVDSRRRVFKVTYSVIVLADISDTWPRKLSNFIIKNVIDRIEAS